MSVKILAIDLGGSKLLTALAIITEKEGIPQVELQGINKMILTKDSGRTGILSALHESVQTTFETTGTCIEDIEKIGATIPGLADAKRGYWIFAPFSGIRDFPLGEELTRYYHRPVFADNDVNACAWAEKVFGVCRNINDFLWITISNGIGGGMVLNGKVYAGVSGGAMEFGHLNIVEEGSPCGCGNRGCMEATAAGPAIARRFLEKLAHERDRAVKEGKEFSHPYFDLKKGTTIDRKQPVSAATIAEAARKGDPLSIQIFEETGYYLGRAASWAANLINPSKIVFGGGVAGAFDLFYPKMEETFRKFLFRNVNEDLTLEKTGLGYEAGLYAAVALAYDPYSLT